MLRHLRVAIAMLATAGLAAAEDPRRPEALDQVSFSSSSQVGIAWDSRGNAVTVGWRDGDIDLWNARGSNERRCQVDPGQAGEFLTGTLGLNDGRVLFAASRGDHSSLNVYDVRRCEAVARTDVPKLAVLGVCPAKNGWLLQVLEITSRSLSILEVDRSGRKVARWSMPHDLAGDDAHAPVPATWAVPLDVDGEVWLIPQSSYRFVRPSQRGKGDYEFRPPDCVASWAKPLTAEESATHAEARAEASKTSPAGRLFGAVADSPSRQSAEGVVVSASASGSRVAALVRQPEGGCRLDVWDFNLERLIFSERSGGSCNTVISLHDEQLTSFGDDRIRRRDIQISERGIDPCK